MSSPKIGDDKICSANGWIMREKVECNYLGEAFDNLKLNLERLYDIMFVPTFNFKIWIRPEGMIRRQCLIANESNPEVEIRDCCSDEMHIYELWWTFNGQIAHVTELINNQDMVPKTYCLGIALDTNDTSLPPSLDYKLCDGSGYQQWRFNITYRDYGYENESRLVQIYSIFNTEMQMFDYVNTRRYKLCLTAEGTNLTMQECEYEYEPVWMDESLSIQLPAKKQAWGIFANDTWRNVLDRSLMKTFPDSGPFYMARNPDHQ